MIQYYCVLISTSLGSQAYSFPSSLQFGDQRRRTLPISSKRQRPAPPGFMNSHIHERREAVELERKTVAAQQFGRITWLSTGTSCTRTREHSTHSLQWVPSRPQNVAGYLHCSMPLSSEEEKTYRLNIKGAASSCQFEESRATAILDLVVKNNCG